MNTDKIDPNKNAAEVPSKDAKTELTVSKVSGGKLNEATNKGTHLPEVIIVA